MGRHKEGGKGKFEEGGGEGMGTRYAQILDATD